MESVNPATGEVLARFDELDDAQLEAKLARAMETFRSYRRTPFAERSQAMSRAADLLDRGKE